MRIKKFSKKQNLLALGILVLSVLIAVFFVKDPYHLLSPNNKINLTSTKIQSIASSIFMNCTKDKQKCYSDKLSAATKTYGIFTGEAILDSLQDFDDSAKNCHVIAHHMAYEAYTRSPWEFYSLMDKVNVNACGSGFLHGILEAYTGDHSEIPIDGTFANTICSRGNDDYRKRMCVHFMGHVFILNAYGELAEALPLCQSIKNEWQFDCYDGIFMEDHQKLILSDHGIMPIPPMTPEYVQGLVKKCNEYDGIMGSACWTEMAEIYAHTYGYQPDIIFKGCSNAKSAQFAKNCYLKGVIAMSTYYTFNTPETLVSLCSYYGKDPNTYAECTYNLLSSLMYYSPKFAPRGIMLCLNIQEQYQPQCYGYLSERLKTLVVNRSERSQLCSTMPDVYKAACVN